MNTRISRRSFLKTASIFSAIGVAPQFLTQLADGATPAVDRFKDNRVLVVFQLGGGNDGLNTVVPHGHDEYYRARPRLGLKGKQILKINDELALNATMAPLKALYDDGKVAIINGVGYPNPNRSHFRSMEIWQTASGSDTYLTNGWVGRYFDNYCSGSDHPQVGVAFAHEQPKAFHGKKGLGISFEHPNEFAWNPGRNGDNLAHFTRLNEPGATSSNTTLDFLRHTTSNAILSSKEVEDAARKADFHSALRGRGDNPLMAVAALIRGGLTTRVYYVSLGSFDTHANQLGHQDYLLGRFASFVGDFHKQLKSDGTADRVVTMVFSEFGRRVYENASAGTDHGTAAPMFLIGDRVKPGLHCPFPSLTTLDHGDLIHTVDFRSVYSAVLKQWLEVNPEPVVKGKFPTTTLIA